MGGNTDNLTKARWCILRTSGSRTIALAESLASVGMEVWTPIAVTRQQVRRGASHVVVERAAPIAPTFVFGNAEQLPDFARILHQPFNPHPGFSIFQWAGRAPLVGEAAMAGLRLCEAEARAAIEAAREDVARRERHNERVALMRTEQQKRKALRSERRDFEKGARVVVAGTPSLAGLAGKVIESRGTSALVAFGGSLVMKIEAWQLVPIAVEADPSTTA